MPPESKLRMSNDGLGGKPNVFEWWARVGTKWLRCAQRSFCAERLSEELFGTVEARFDGLCAYAKHEGSFLM